jgi:hypothetical protein
MRRANRRNEARVFTAFTAILTAATLLALAGCSNDDDKNPMNPGGGTPTTSQFTGFMTDGAQSGKIVVTINSTSLAGRYPGLRAPGADVAASATFTFDGSTTTVTGLYEDQGDTLNLSGSGYTLKGILESGGGTPSIIGDFTGPSSAGLFAAVTNALAPKAYCGTWNSSTQPDSGTFNFVANDTAFAGLAVAATDPEPQDFSGQLSGTGTTRTLNGGSGDTSTAELVITGTLNTATGAASGTWTYTVYDVMYGTDDNGTWEGTLCP